MISSNENLIFTRVDTTITGKHLMNIRLTLFLDFVGTFIRYTLRLREVIMSLLVLIVSGGFIISKVEEIELGDAVYFAFITALTIGYGDIAPTTPVGKIVSIGIGLVGMIFVGISVAIANRALADTAKKRYEQEVE
ncbi:potassium channel family protein [Rosistilla oblonga]|uniref:potassium channel family protein n=2 Tax=Bacteria TaxID=2 RepID=UPI003A986F9F